MINIRLKKEIKKLSAELNIPESIVQEAFYSQFKFFKDTVEEMDFSNMTEEEITNNKTNFSFKYLGKFYTNYKRVDKINKRKQNKNKREQNGRD